MSMLAGSDPVMAANGTVTGTANSLSLAIAQAHAARFIAPALVAIDAAIAGGLDASAGADQKAAIVEAWNEAQAPWLQDLAAAVISHIQTYAEVTTIIAASGGGGLQRLPDPPDAFAGTLAPASDLNLEGTIA